MKALIPPLTWQEPESAALESAAELTTHLTGPDELTIVALQNVLRGDRWHQIRVAT